MRISLLLSAIGAAQAISFFKRKQPIIGNAYANAASACCACFKHKYAWPENSGMPATTANAHTCNTCYAADRYGIETKTTSTIAIPQGTCPTATGSDDRPTVTRSCEEYCDTAPEGQQCTFAIFNTETNEFLESRTYAGAGACQKIVEDEELLSSMAPPGTFDSVCEIDALAQACPTACGSYGCSAGTGGNDSDYKKAVHEWNWNCADGKAPSLGEPWLKGPVDGEPAARAPYVMCSEENEWYCHNADSDDFRKTPDMDKPEALSESTCDVSYVGLLKLPSIDMAKVR